MSDFVMIQLFMKLVTHLGAIKVAKHVSDPTHNHAVNIYLAVVNLVAEKNIMGPVIVPQRFFVG